MRRGVVGLGLVIALGACLIAQPPGDPPPLELKAPVIASGDVVPSLGAPITTIQPNTKLLVPVAVDPEATLDWRVFLDFDPLTGGLQLDLGVPLEPDVTLNPIRMIQAGLFGAFETGQCHTLTLVVAACKGTSCSGFNTGSKWVPLSPGGDQETWFYRPNGNEGSCPGYDAGTFPDAAAFDTGAE